MSCSAPPSGSPVSPAACSSVHTADASFLQLPVLLPFLLATLIWGSTWIVIRDQIAIVPPPWSVTYRFIIAAVAMFIYAFATSTPLRIGRRGHMLAALFGIPQFSINFNLVYAAEHFVTSGLVAVVFALLIVPNSALGWLFLKQRVTGRFMFGSAVALAGVALLFVQEMRGSAAAPREVPIGIALTLLAVFAASIANVIQAAERMKTRPIAAMLAWGMVYGVIANAISALILYGPPVAEPRLLYWAGLIYLGLFASALAFTLYFGLLRRIGPAKAAYSNVLIPILAMALSTLFENYRWSTLAVAGGLLAFTGLVIALRSGRPGGFIAR